MNALEKLIHLKQWYADNFGRLQSQPAQVEAIRAEHDIENIIRDLYTKIFCKHLGGCGQCLADAFCVLIHYPNEKLQEIMNCRFKLKSGVLLIDTHGRLPITTHSNLTDEIAIAYLRDNIGRKNLFEVLPTNLDELLKEDNGEKKEEATTEAAPEAEPAPAPIKRTRKKK